MVRYQKRHDLSYEEFLNYICDTNSSNDTVYEVIGEDYTGLRIFIGSIEKFDVVSYEHSDYSQLHNIFNSADTVNSKIAFAPEFTDDFSGMKVFAMYTYLTLTDSDGIMKTYTIMGVEDCSYFSELINIDRGFSDMSTALIKSDGGYILSNLSFRSENFFEYIALYNDMNKDETSAVNSEVLTTKSGSMEYNNMEGEKCIFVYTPVPNTSWYSVTCLPIQSFHNKTNELNYTVAIIVILMIVLGTDVLWLAITNKRLKESAMEAMNANNAKTDFLSSMSHDIRTPINVINGMTELAMGESNPEVVLEYLGNIQSSGKFLLGLVNDILDLNKVESGKMELHPSAYEFSEFRRYINAVIKPLCEAKNIDFDFTCNKENAVFIIDSLRLNQIFFNILSNSSKFTGSNGKISFDCNVNSLGGDNVELVFTAKDNGIGMSEAFQKKMFDSFAQENRTYESGVNGTGLGLSIVKRIVDLMGGSIEVNSEENKGTEFIIRLKSKLSYDMANKATEEIDESVLVGKRVLLCEDHPLNTKIVVKLLENRGMIVDTAENGKIGYDMFVDSELRYYSAILMDIRMPVMNGIEATMAIRRVGERSDALSIPIIALTANAYDTDIASCKMAGANEHLAKPIDSKLLYETLARYIG